MAATLLFLVPVAVLGGLCWAAWGSVAAILSRAWRSPGSWVRFAVLGATGTLLVYGIGLFSGFAHEIDETCHRLGEEYDDAYRAERWREPGRWFPLHNRCNADYDLVPAYVNPSLVVLAAVAVGCAAVAVALAIAGRRRP
ncbi:hypothetical protein ACN28C_02455 [Plantactinospora sp. WMMC1484]|uniref:hypothetical protein n=1 Tax=Plantactinospora sp. WMMC1484 TaxID=3404122 RepID=UPI003BF5FCFD